jgi:speckle-type POZ protein
MWQRLLVAADRYDLLRLRLICEQKLCSYINTTTAATILALAEQHHGQGLKNACLDFLIRAHANLQEVMVLGGLDHLASTCPLVLKELIAQLVSPNKKARIDVNTAFFVVPASDMHQHFTCLLQSGEGTDVVFEVSGEKLHAHRCVLAARSAVFRAELFGPMKEGTTTGVIRIDDMEAKVFKLLLTFIYSDSMPDINEDEEYDDKEDMEEDEEEDEDEEEEEDDDDDDDDDDVDDIELMWQHLLVAADRYDLQRLRLMCENKLCGYINATKVASILELAEQHHCRGLKEACLDFLNFPPNLQQVMAAGGLNHLRSSCPSVLIDLIAKLAYLKPDN